MKEYRVVASIHHDLLKQLVDRNSSAKASRHSTSIHTIKCKSLEEMPDLFLDVCGNECYGMDSRIYWYVDAGDGWVLTEL